MELFISIHAPTRGATNCEKIWRFLVQFQSTLPREERHNTRTVVIVVLDISIHAPTRGATDNRAERTDGHTNFNPRSHERSDTCRNNRHQGIQISIHAPTRGATKICLLIQLLNLFQSTLPREERHGGVLSALQPYIFQSTLPREERPSNIGLSSANCDFNPRSHERSDLRGFDSHSLI